MLREDNADLRLTEIGRSLGLVDDRRFAAFEARRDAIEAERTRLESLRVTAGSEAARAVESAFGTPVRKDVRAADLLKRPEIDYARLVALPPFGPGVDRVDVAEQVETGIRYAGYLARQAAEIERSQASESRPIPAEFDFAQVRGLSAEVLEKLQRQRPATVGEASRIPGVTPAAISQLLVWLKRDRNAA
jgi:tRNA uridine 5-carboxymethylaminomethyl modification enzyme